MANVRTTSRFIALPDVHAPLQDKKALRLVLNAIPEIKPSHCLALGDWIDASAISTFARDAEDTDLLYEFEECNGILDQFEAAGYPITHIFEGNHEHRTRKPKNVPRELRRLMDPRYWLHLKERRIKWIPYSNNPRDVFRLGKLTFLHGFTASQAAGKRHAERFGDCVFGHTHRIGIQTIPVLGGYYTSYNIGCLCQLDLEYVSHGMPPGWGHGFLYGSVAKSGKYSAHLVQIAPDKLIEIAGKSFRL